MTFLSPPLSLCLSLTFPKCQTSQVTSVSYLSYIGLFKPFYSWLDSKWWLPCHTLSIQNVLNCHVTHCPYWMWGVKETKGRPTRCIALNLTHLTSLTAPKPCSSNHIIWPYPMFNICGCSFNLLHNSYHIIWPYTWHAIHIGAPLTSHAATNTTFPNVWHM